MPKTKKTLLPLGLAGYDVYIEDTSQNSEYFRVSNLPPAFTGGKNSFLLGGSTFLQNGSEIKIEILDSNGLPIYQSLVQNYIEGTSKMMSVEIYDTTPPGFATIIIMGKAIQTAAGTPIPEEWKDVYNVRWSKRILVDYQLKNTSPIRFKNEPGTIVEEKRFYNINSSSYDTFTASFTASLTPILYSGVQVGYGIYAETPTTFSGAYRDATITGSLIINNKNSGTIYLPITKILNKTSAFSSGYLMSSSINNGKVKQLYLRSGSYTTLFDNITYPVTTSAVIQYNVTNISQVNIPISYADIRIFNLDTVSGELYKFRVYSKPTTNTGDYKIIGDVYVNTNEILVSSSIRGNTPIGDIYVTTNYQDVWYAGNLEKNTSILAPIYPISGSSRYYSSSISTGQLAVSSSDDVLLSSIYAEVPIDLSTNKFSNQISESGYFIGTTNSYSLFSSTEYTLTLDAYYRKTSGSVTLTGIPTKVDIYIVGIDGTKIIDRNPLGQKIGELTVSNDVRWIEQKQFNFYPAVNFTGKVGLRFVVSNGFWNFSNISLKPASDNQFSPDEVQLLIPNMEYHNELVQYKIEFFDINNNSAAINAISAPVFFTGSVIDLGTFSPPPPPPPPPPPSPPSPLSYTWVTSSIYAISGNTTQSWNDVLWVTSSTLNTWLAGGSRGFATSSDGLTWTETYNIGSGSLGEINNIVWVDHLSMLAAALTIKDEADQRIEIITSSNAINWSSAARIPTQSGEDSVLYSLRYANDINSLLLVQGSSLDDVLTFYTSSDAQTWGVATSQSFGGNPGTSSFAGRGLARNSGSQYWITGISGSTNFAKSNINGNVWNIVNTFVASGSYADGAISSNYDVYFAASVDPSPMLAGKRVAVAPINSLNLIGLVGYEVVGTAYSASVGRQREYGYTTGSMLTQSLFTAEADNGYIWITSSIVPTIRYQNGTTAFGQWDLMRTRADNTILLFQSNIDTQAVSTGTHSVAIGTSNL